MYEYKIQNIINFRFIISNILKSISSMYKVYTKLCWSSDFNKHVNLYKSIIDKKRNVSSHFDEASFPENHIINENQFQSQNPLKKIFYLRRSEIFVRM